MATEREALLLQISAFSAFVISSTDLSGFFAVPVTSQTKSDRLSKLFRRPAVYMFKYIALDLGCSS